MIHMRPFRSYRPIAKHVAKIAALPYDVVSKDEAKNIIATNPYSFLNIDKPEARLGKRQEHNIYEEANKVLQDFIQREWLVQEDQSCYYIYGLETSTMKQYGIVGCFSCEDYSKGFIKKHEYTRTDKEEDRLNHIRTCHAQTGPIFLAYKASTVLENFIQHKKHTEALYDFTDDLGVRQVIYKIDKKDDHELIEKAFASLDALYIADGHHRAAAACRYAEENKDDEAKQFFMGVAFPKDELTIMPYHRMVKVEKLLSIKEVFATIENQWHIEQVGTTPYEPKEKNVIGMGYKGCWYKLTLKKTLENANKVKALNVSLLQDYVLAPVFHITNPRMDERLVFVGGEKRMDVLSEAIGDGAYMVFTLCETSFDEMIEVVEEAGVMPPKSTWFEPKLRSGIFIHYFDHV